MGGPARERRRGPPCTRHGSEKQAKRQACGRLSLSSPLAPHYLLNGGTQSAGDPGPDTLSVLSLSGVSNDKGPTLPSPPGSAPQRDPALDQTHRRGPPGSGPPRAEKQQRSSLRLLPRFGSTPRSRPRSRPCQRLCLG